MPHHAIEILITNLVYRMAGKHFLVIPPALVVLVLCLVYIPLAYLMFRTKQDSDE